MSLEQALQKHGELLAANTAALLGSKTPPAAAPKPTTTAGKKAAAPKTGPSYDDVTKAALALNKVKGREGLKAVLEQFGVAAAKELKPEQFADFIAKAEAAAKDEAPAEDDSADLV